MTTGAPWKPRATNARDSKRQREKKIKERGETQGERGKPNKGRGRYSNTHTDSEPEVQRNKRKMKTGNTAELYVVIANAEVLPELRGP